jgi:hypothetical protein
MTGKESRNRNSNVAFGTVLRTSVSNEASRNFLIFFSFTRQLINFKTIYARVQKVLILFNNPSKNIFIS